MIYTSLTRLALKVSFEAHKDQVDHSGTPYVYHPYHLAEQMTDETTTCIALLHDVVEDSAVTMAEIAAAFPPEIAEAVRLLTHDKETPYLDYIRTLRTNPLARKVKLADLAHNSDESRLRDAVANEPALVRKRRAKYEAAQAILLEKNAESEESQ